MMLLNWLSALGIGLGRMSDASGTPPVCADSLAPTRDSLAEHFAPWLRFGPSERYFPTIPFFQAFDTIDGGRGLLDTARIAPIRRRPHGPDDSLRSRLISWQALRNAYRDRVKADTAEPSVFIPPHAAVFYRVRCLTGREPKQLWGFLQNDPQGWDRSGVDSLYRLGLRFARFTVIEYYLYYVEDVGLQGHPHDIERVVVFVPRSIDSTRAAQAGLADTLWGRTGGLVDSLRIVVGTGHSATTPNNVLVALHGVAKALRSPSILVELGGHSSAPDLNRDSQLHPGLDVNWNLSGEVWGTRDAQAVSGRGYLGRYESWMTLPRLDGRSVLIQPVRTEAQVDTGQAIAQRDTILGGGDPTQSPLYDDPESAPKDSSRSARVGAGDTAQYALLPVSYFERLAHHVARMSPMASDSEASARADSVRRIVNDSIAPRLRERWGFFGFRDASKSEILAAMRAMAYWNKPLDAGSVNDRTTYRTVMTSAGPRSAGEAVATIKVSATTIWQHPEFNQSPVGTLKRRLYRPTTNGLRNAGDFGALLTYNLGGLGGGRIGPQLGVVVPAFGGRASVPGNVEVQVGCYFRMPDNFWGDFPLRALCANHERTRFAVSALYERHWRRVFSWYVRPLSYAKDRARIESDPGASDYAAAVGVSIMPFLPLPDLLLGWASRLRIRAGLRFNLADWKPSRGRFEFQTTMYIR